MGRINEWCCANRVFCVVVCSAAEVVHELHTDTSSLLLHRTLYQFATTVQAEEATLPPQEKQSPISDKAAVFFSSNCLSPSSHTHTHTCTHTLNRGQMHKQYVRTKTIHALSESTSHFVLNIGPGLDTSGVKLF